MKVVLRTLLATSLLLAGLQAFAQTLKVGSAAPPIKVAQWVKGTPVREFVKGQIYVVEFWATWCGPCKEVMPHLSEMAQKYEGKVTFTGVSVFEESLPLSKDTSFQARVEAFVKKMGDRMAYNVAFDGDAAAMASSYMKAAGKNAIPATFVIDGTGTIAWIGHPSDGLDDILQKIIDGSFDPKAELARQAEVQALRDAQQAEMKPLWDAIKRKDYPAALKEVDKLINASEEGAMRFGIAKLGVLFNFDPAAGNQYAVDYSKTDFGSQYGTLAQIVMFMARTDYPVAGVDFKVVREIGERGLAMQAPNTNLKARLMDSLAVCYFRLGDKAKALDMGGQALRLAKAEKRPSDDFIEQIEAHLEMFKKSSSLR